MNKIIKIKKIVIIVLAIIMLTLSFGNIARAELIDTTRKASLTITKYEHANGSSENVEFAGVEFTVYMIQDTIYTVDDAIEYVKNNQVTSYTKTTPEDGTIKFSNLELGRYLVVETNSPKNVVAKVESFLIDLPRSNDNGNSWEYDVTVYPKNTTIYGSVTLNQRTQDMDPLEGVIWILQKLNQNNQWEKYDYEGTLKTDENGQVKLDNLEKGSYRLLRENGPEGYIIDASDTIEFDIDNDNIDYEFTEKNEKLEVNKYVLQDDKTYGKDVGVFKNDIHSWKIVADVANIITKMDEYKISDKLPEELSYKTDSINVWGINKNNEEVNISEDFYTKKLSTNSLELDFNPKQLEQYKNIIVKYDTNFNDTVSYGDFVNTVNLVYTDYISQEGTCEGIYNTSSEASIHTGAVLVKKTDQYKNALSGASFKIATSKDEAKAGVFIKDKNGEDIIVTSDDNGYAIFEGLKYDVSTQYWIVEVQAPSYEENGEVKYYNLLQSPVKVIVDSTSQEYSEDYTTIVVNKKGFVLPMTGGTLSIVSSVLGLCIISIVMLINKRKSN